MSMEKMAREMFDARIDEVKEMLNELAELRKGVVEAIGDCKILRARFLSRDSSLDDAISALEKRISGMELPLPMPMLPKREEKKAEPRKLSPTAEDRTKEKILMECSGRYYKEVDVIASNLGLSKTRVLNVVRNSDDYELKKKLGSVLIRKKVRALPLLLSVIKHEVNISGELSYKEFVDVIKERHPEIVRAYQRGNFSSNIATALRRLENGVIPKIDGVTVYYKEDSLYIRKD